MRTTKVLAVLMTTMMSVSFFSGMVMSGDITSDSKIFSDPIRIFNRPPFKFNACFIGNESSNQNNTSLLNFTTQQIDVYKYYTFCVNISDQDGGTPNITYMTNVTVTGYVNFVEDPGYYWPDDGNVSNSSFSKRNFQFAIKANRKEGGGNNASSWVFDLLYPNPFGGENELEMMWSNCSAINERDLYKGDAGSAVLGQDTVNDTLELRWQFRFGNQSRNTNWSIMNNSADNWNFYATAFDIYGARSNSTGLFPQWFDVYRKCVVGGGGKVAGSSAPGAGAFKLDRGNDPVHIVMFSANNNCSFWVNATDICTTYSWSADTLWFNVHGDQDINDVNWTQVGPDYTWVGRCNHSDNGTRAKQFPGPGENGFGFVHWKCSGIPLGVPSGAYNSTLSVKIIMEGT